MQFSELLMTAAAQGGGVSYDADAAAYFAALGTTLSASVKSSINTFVLDIKSQGRWTSGLQILPFVTATAADNLVNLKSPGTVNANSFNGSGFTHSATNGVTSDATAGTYLNLGFNRPALGATTHYTLLYLRTRSPTTLRSYYGTDNFGGGSDSYFFFEEVAGTSITFYDGSAIVNVSDTTAALGTFICNRTATNGEILPPDETTYTSGALTTDATLADFFVPLFGRARVGSMIQNTAFSCGFWMCGTESLSAASAVSLRTSVVTLMTSLGRNV